MRIKEDDLIPEIFSDKKRRDSGLILASPHPILAEIVQQDLCELVLQK